MKCMKCNYPVTSLVIDCRMNQAKTTKRRRRECVMCGYRWSTIEIDADELKRLQAMDVKMKKVKKHAHQLVGALRESHKKKGC